MTAANVTRAQAQKIVNIASKHANTTVATMRTSAAVALEDAEGLLAAGRYGDAARRGLKSLAYSVGTFDAAYLRAARVIDEAA